MTNISYFDKLTDSLNLHLKNDVTFDELKSLFKDKKINLNYKVNPSLISSLNEINRVLDLIINIIYHPHYIAREEKTLLRSEQAYNIDIDSFLMTTKDSSLWKKKDQTLMPEYIYSNIYDDSINTYENKFIIYVYNQIFELLNYTFVQHQNKVNSLESIYKQNYLKFAKVTFINDFKEHNKTLTNQLLPSKKTTSKDDLLNKVYRKAKRIRFTTFYKKLNKEKIVLPIIPTNILLHDYQYYRIYRYYKNYLSQEGNKQTFYNYIVLKLIESLLKNKYQFDNDFVVKYDNEIYFDRFICSKDQFIYEIAKDNHNLIVNILCDNQKSHNYLVIKENLNEINAYQKFDNVIYICSNNNVKALSNVYEISLSAGMKPALSIENIFLSLRLTLNGKKLIKQCPVCGNSSLDIDDKSYYCNQCHSSFAVIKRKRSYSIWIKSLWRKEDGE